MAGGGRGRLIPNKMGMEGCILIWDFIYLREYDVSI